MKHRTAFIIASALTAFVLVFVGGITATVTPKAVAFNPSPTDAPTDTATDTSTVAPSATSTSTATATIKPTQPKPAAPQISMLLPDQAARIAMKVAPNGKLQEQPQLVNYKGQMAYEVLFDLGPVYVDAFSGKILYSGIGLTPTETPSPTPDPPASTGGGGGGGRHGGGGGGGNPGPSGPPPSGGNAGGGSNGGGGGGGHGGGGGGDDGGGGDH
jgi:hypothetical protein